MLLGPKSIIVTLLHLIINDIPTILSLKLLQKLLKNCNTKKGLKSLFIDTLYES